MSLTESGKTAKWTKSLSYVLRYGTFLFDLDMDEEGYVSFEKLTKATLPGGVKVTNEDLREMTRLSVSVHGGNPIFQIIDKDGDMYIRAALGCIWKSKKSNTLIDLCLESISNNLVRYTDIDLTGCLAPDVIQMLIRRLKASKKLTNNVLKTHFLNDGIQQLRLDGTYVSDSTLIDIGRYCVNLNRLDISRQPTITDSQLRMSISKLKSLTHLKMASCENITDKGLVHLAKSLPSLKMIDISNCPKVKGESLSVLCSSCPLEVIDIHGNNQFSEACLQSAVIYMKKVNSILVSSVSNFSSACLSLLVDASSELEDVVMKKCRQIDDAAISHLFQKQPKLKWGCFRFCSKITDESIKSLLQSACRNTIEWMDLSKTQVTSNGIQIICESCPYLKRLTVSQLNEPPESWEPIRQKYSYISFHF